jgi:hypothetical protein
VAQGEEDRIEGDAWEAYRDTFLGWGGLTACGRNYINRDPFALTSSRSAGCSAGDVVWQPWLVAMKRKIRLPVASATAPPRLSWGGFPNVLLIVVTCAGMSQVIHINERNRKHIVCLARKGHSLDWFSNALKRLTGMGSLDSSLWTCQMLVSTRS